MNRCIISFCSEVVASGGFRLESMSLLGPLLKVTGLTPTLSNNPCRLMDCMMTPMEPVMVSSFAKIYRQGAAT